MKIRKIVFDNHPILGNLNLDFTNKDGKTVNTIIIAGENGVGKSLLLNTIFKFSSLTIDNAQRNEKLKYEIELDETDINILKKNATTKGYFNKPINDNILYIAINYNIISNWNQILIEGQIEGKLTPLVASLFAHEDTKTILRMIFSDVEINFTPRTIQTVTSKNIDRLGIQSERSNSELATDITQLLIDVQSIDALEFTEWARKNTGKLIDNEKIDVRIKRFTSAFEFMFPSKKYKRIENVNNSKQIIFEENGREMDIDKLSSGEKQIVFRGSFLLKDRESSKGALILIDEPEISLHPDWQLKVLSFFKKLFTTKDGDQTSQIIVSTHSPFIIHNSNRLQDKVIVLKKDPMGKTIVLDEPTFYSWSAEKIVQEAFNVSNVLGNSKITVFVEGETDELYYNKCLEIFNKTKDDIEFKWIGRINENGKVENTGYTALNQVMTFFKANMDQVKHKIILFYDSDTNKPEEKIENLFIRKMASNPDNKTYKIGIENLLTLIPEIDLSTFYKTTTKTDNYGAVSTYSELDKTKLCSFICSKLNKDKQKLVLKKLDLEIGRLLTVK